VRTTDDDGAAPAGALVMAGPPGETPVPIGTAGVTVAPAAALDAVGVNEARATELAEEASATGQTV
jgi:hypothetical protein